MKCSEWHILLILTVVVSIQLCAGHKTQFRVLGLQYGTLNQRFELENKLLRVDLDTAKSDIRDLKADNARIIQLFEVFTEEVRDLKTTLLQETLKLKSLEADFKILQNLYEDLRDSRLSSNEYENSTKRKEIVYACSDCENDIKHVEGDTIDDSDKDIHDNIDNEILKGKIYEGKADISPGMEIFAARYGEKYACFLKLHNLSITSCVQYLGEGVRVVAADKDRLYWSDDNRKLIMSSALTGSDVRVINTDLTTLGLAVDQLHQVLFYTNVSGDVFRKTLTDENDKGRLWTNIGERPRRIFIDERNKLIYAITNTWTGIVRINYFTNKQELLVQTQGRIKSLTVDIRNQILYFGVNSSIYVKDLLDKAAFPIFEGSSMPSDLLMYGNQMYVAYYHSSKIDVIDLKTREITNTVDLPWKGDGNTVSICLVQNLSGV